MIVPTIGLIAIPPSPCAWAESIYFNSLKAISFHISHVCLWPGLVGPVAAVSALCSGADGEILLTCVEIGLRCRILQRTDVCVHIANNESIAPFVNLIHAQGQNDASSYNVINSIDLTVRFDFLISPKGFHN